MRRPVAIEPALATYLNDKLDAPVSTLVPNPRPARFVRLQRGGGTAGLALERPMLIVECWGTSVSDAFGLAQDAWSALADAEGSVLSGCWVSEPGLSSPVYNPDVETGQHRYQFMANMVIGLQLA